MPSKLKIVFLDAATLDLGDVDFRSLYRQGDFQPVSRCRSGRIPARLRDAQILISNKVPLKNKELPLFPNLKLVCVAATGVNNVDLRAAKKLGVGVCNVAGYSTTTVVEHTLMFLLTFSHRFMEHYQAVKEKKWSRSPLFTLLDYPFEDLEGKTLGILGYGHIGRRVAKLARALGMRVLKGKISGRQYPRSQGRVGLQELLRKSDFVSLNCPLSPLTQGLIHKKNLRLMKPSAYLINTARGPVVVEEDVVQALKNNRLAGYAADVTTQEPIPKGHPFLQKALKHKVILTPHIAWASRESRQRMIEEIAANIAAFKKGQRRNRVV